MPCSDFTVFFAADMEGFATIPFGPVNKFRFDDGQIASHQAVNYSNNIYLGRMADCDPIYSAYPCKLFSFAAAYVISDNCTRALSSFAVIRSALGFIGESTCLPHESTIAAYASCLGQRGQVLKYKYMNIYFVLIRHLGSR